MAVLGMLRVDTLVAATAVEISTQSPKLIVAQGQHQQHTDLSCKPSPASLVTFYD